MANQETFVGKPPKIVFLNDADGVLFKAPPPLATAIKLIRGKPVAQGPERPFKEDFSSGNIFTPVKSAVGVFLHEVRPPIPEALQGLRVFRRIAEEQQRELIFGVSSGRKKDKHQLTKRQLALCGFDQFFGKNVFLNRGKSSTPWKVQNAKWFLSRGCVVIHIDDDLDPTLEIARLQEQFGMDAGLRVLGYLVNNVSNHPRLLKRAGIELPKNVVRVNSHMDAASDFEARVVKEEI